LAMAPYEVTLPYGIWRATAYTLSKKLASINNSNLRCCKGSGRQRLR
jgi:hypothetical protein